MTELEIMIRAKTYIDSLANGIDPLTGQTVKNDDIVNNVRISRCLFYVSGILQKVIDNGGEVQKEKMKRSQRAEFCLTDEQIRSLSTQYDEQSVSRITTYINEQIDDKIIKKLKASTLNNWLVSVGLLTQTENEEGKKQKIPTQEGEMMGLQLKEATNYKGTYKYVSYNRNAQQFIFDNMEAVIEFAHQEENMKKDKAITDNTSVQ